MPTAITPGWDRAARESNLTLELADAAPLFFRLVPPGEFRMGSRGEYVDEEPIHLVHITSPFYLGTFPVTQAQFAVWTRATGIEHENGFKNKPSHPAENLDWNQAKAFCRWVNENYGSHLPAGHQAALPTEAQWEYACRAGTDMEYNTGDGAAALAAAGWFDENSDSSTHPVGGKEPNKWGLYDMHGNVWEWCEDARDWHVYMARVDGVADPVVRASDLWNENPHRVVRGGSWDDSARFCRSAFRGWRRPGIRDWNLGFRLCLVPGPVAGAEIAAKKGKAKPDPGDGGRGTRPESEGSGVADAFGDDWLDATLPPAYREKF